MHVSLLLTDGICNSVVVTVTVTKLNYLHVVKQMHRINRAMHKRKSAAQNFTVVHSQ